MTNLWSNSTLSESPNSILVILVSQNTFGQALAHTGEYGDLEKHFDEATELNPLDPNAISGKDGLFSAQTMLIEKKKSFLVRIGNQMTKSMPGSARMWKRHTTRRVPAKLVRMMIPWLLLT